MSLVTRIRGFLRTDVEEPATFEGEILAHDAEAVAADTHAASGDGAIVGTLPETTAAGLFTQFDEDQERPDDSTP